MKIHTHINQLLADTKTPVALYLALRDHYQNPLLLESSDYNSKDGHYSYICLSPLASITLNHNNLQSSVNGVTTNRLVNEVVLVNELIEFKNQFEFESQTLPFCYAGLFGYTSYDIVNYIEDIKLNSTKTQNDIPELLYYVYGIILVFNHHTNSLTLISHHYSEEDSINQLTEIYEKIKVGSTNEFSFSTISETQSSITDNAYKDLVSKAKEHCQGFKKY